MRWSRDVRRDTQRLRPVTRSLAIIRCDIVPARSPSEDRRQFPSEGTHAYTGNTVAHFRIRTQNGRITMEIGDQSA
ncbi:hypothetical protein ACS0PU_009354 [Formica fusca]